MTHVLVVWTPNGYRLKARTGEPHSVGAEIDEENSRFVVTKVTSSRLPGDERRCACLDPVR